MSTTVIEQTMHVVVNLSKEDRQRLDELIAFAGLIVGELKSKPQTMDQRMSPGSIQALAEAPQEAQDAPNLEVVKSDHPAEDVSPFPEAEDVAPAEEPKPAVTLDQIRQKVTYLRASSDQKKKDGAKDIVLAYAPNITGLANCEDKWPEIWDKLTALEG